MTETWTWFEIATNAVARETRALETHWGGPFRAKRWSVTLAARNLWMATRYKGTGDPEVSFESDPNTFDRTDYAAVPQPRRLSATINVTF